MNASEPAAARPAPTGAVRIANCSGFFGDRPSAAREMVDGGPIDVLTGDWLAELTMLILARIGMKHPGRAFARSFVSQMEDVMGTCLDRGIRIVSNAGGLNPDGCAEAVAEVAERLGLSPSIAYVDGDDLAARVRDLAADGDLVDFDSGSGIGDISEILTANAYLGGWGIAQALDSGADIVITGRVTDAALTCGPAAWFHNWARNDWDQLAGAVVAGHVIECGAQATGGNYSFFDEIPGFVDGSRSRLGFPWAEVYSDGTSIIGKHDQLGGAVTVGTVTSQLLYEIGEARYLGPEVTAHFDTIELEQTAPDRVRISGVTGEAPPPTLKVAMNQVGGYRNSIAVALTGLDIEAKAAVAEAVFWDAYAYGREELETVTSIVGRTDQPDPLTQEQATAVWRLTVRDSSPDKVGRAFTDAMVNTALASVPGVYLLSGPPAAAAPYGVYRPALVPAALVPQFVHVNDSVIEVASVAPSELPSMEVPPPVAEPVRTPTAGDIAAAPTRRVALGEIVGTRSGDKGGHANLGVFVRSADQWAWLDGYLTLERFAEILPETASLDVSRHAFPNLFALNFVIRDLLQEGVAASTRQDAQAKALGEWLRARHAEIPITLLDEER